MARNEDKRFVFSEQQNSFMNSFSVLVDKRTGVNYLVISGGNGLSGVTPLWIKTAK